MRLASPTSVTLNHPLFRGQLSLHRVPKYLRFTWTGKGTAACSKQWDALDQLSDEPQAGETLIAGVLADRGRMHIDGTRNGKRFGEWRETARYDVVMPQPSQGVMQSRELWMEWCTSQVERENDATVSRKADGI